VVSLLCAVKAFKGESSMLNVLITMLPGSPFGAQDRPPSPVRPLIWAASWLLLALLMLAVALLVLALIWHAAGWSADPWSAASPILSGMGSRIRPLDPCGGSIGPC
jgi:hypothetical protein